jgi:type II secretory pathway pseudopilin PulG
MTLSRRGGMTLMELVIGITITGMMAAAGAASFGAIIDHRKEIRDATVEMERAGALREMLRSWLVAGTVQIQQGGVPQLGGRAGAAQTSSASSNTAPSNSASSRNGITAAASTGDEVTFSTTALTPAMAASVRVRLFVDADPNTAERGLTIEYQPNALTPLQRRQLEPSVGDMRVEFLDQRTNRWYRAAEAATIQPLAVRIALLPPDGGKLPGILELPMVFTIGQAFVGPGTNGR